MYFGLLCSHADDIPRAITSLKHPASLLLLLSLVHSHLTTEGFMDILSSPGRLECIPLLDPLEGTEIKSVPRHHQRHVRAPVPGIALFHEERDPSARQPSRVHTGCHSPHLVNVACPSRPA